MRGLYRKMSALLLSLALAVQPGLAALPLSGGMQSYAAENAADKASASDLKRSHDKRQNKKQSSGTDFGAAALRKASDANLNRSGENSISLAAETEENAAAAGKGRALIIAQTGDSSLGDGPSKDAEALMHTLLRTEQFDEDSIGILHVPQDAEDESYREAVWRWIDQAAEEGSELNFIAYSGHGDYHNDGSSELSLGDKNSISAQELKEHVSKLSGKLILALDCCYSGGMIMPTSLEDGEAADSEMTAASPEELQKQADQEMKDFVSAFRKAKGTSTASLQYYIYAAASAYETGIQGTYGGQLLVALGHALGYDRNDDTYNVFAADTGKETGEITAAELADYLKNSGSIATPTVYPNKSSEVLFTYTKDSGSPAVLTVRSAETGNVKLKLGSNGSVTVKVRVQNHGDTDVTVNAMAASSVFSELDRPGDYDTVMGNIEDRYQDCIMSADETAASIAANSTKTVSLTFTGDAEMTGLSDGGRFLVRVWDTENPENYGIADFYVAANNQDAEAPDAAAFALRKPAVIYSAENAAEVSAMVPINVQFDAEPTDKTGYASCTLTARYYDLGDSSGANESKNLKGYQVDKGGDVSADDDVVLNEDGWNNIYKDIRPVYNRTDIYAGTLNGSTYNYVWDVSRLKDGHYYALQVICDYGSTQKKLATFIKKVEKADADKAENVIGEVNLASRAFASGYNGIRLGENWSSKTAATISREYTKYLNTQSFTCRTVGEGDEKQSIPYLSARVEGHDGGTGWYEVTESNGDLSLGGELAEDAVFEAGKSYMSRIHLTIDEAANARFADNVVFTVAGHSLYDDGSNRSTVLADTNDKEAVIYVLHKDIGIEDSKLKLCRAGSKTVLPDGTALKAGDQLDIYCADGYDYTVDSSLREISVSAGDFRRFEVLGTDDSIGIMLYQRFSGRVTEKDSCATRLFLYPVSDAVYTQGDSFSVSGDFKEAGKNTVLSAAEKKNLQLFVTRDYDIMENARVTINVSHMLRLEKENTAVAEYPIAEPQKGAKISYLIPYPTSERLYKHYDYELVEKDGSIKVDFEAREDGLWITADRNGSFTLYGQFHGGDDGGFVDPDEDKEDSSGSHSHSGAAVVSRAVSGSWQLQTQSTDAGTVQHYHFRLANGRDATGWQLIRWNNAEHWFFFDSNGDMRTGWLKDGGKWYYLEKDGTMAVGWHYENGSWYYLEGSGSMATGWLRVGLYWYYFAADGRMQTGRQIINGMAQSFREDGSWISNKV